MSKAQLRLMVTDKDFKYLAFHTASKTERAWSTDVLELLLCVATETKEVSDIRLSHDDKIFIMFGSDTLTVLLNPIEGSLSNKPLPAQVLDAFFKDRGCQVQELTRLKKLASLNLHFTRVSNANSDRSEHYHFRLQGVRNSYSKTASASDVCLRPLREVPEFEDLNPHPLLYELNDLNVGMIVVAGETGQGKSTLLCALVARRAKKKYLSILTAERPIEYNIQHIKGLRSSIKQFDCNNDAEGGLEALIESFLRMHPNLIYISEVRAANEISLMLHAQRTKHQVMTTTHANRAWEIFSRLVKQLPFEQQKSEMIDMIMNNGAVVAQKLFSTKKSGVIAIQDYFRLTDSEKFELVELAKSDDDGFSSMSFRMREMLREATNEGRAISQDEHLRLFLEQGTIDQEEYDQFMPDIGVT